jgi:conflict system STAND superfamily ATPase
MDLEKLGKLTDQWKGLLAGVAALVVAIVGVRKALVDLDLRTWSWVEVAVAAVSIVVLAITFVRTRKAHVSRLIDPDALKLDPKLPEHLFGRGPDLDRVLRALANPLVFLVGESGCGKSALLRAGIAKGTAFTQRFLPIYIDMSALEWDAGPLREVREGFAHAIPDDDPARTRLDARSTPTHYAEAFEDYHRRTQRRPLLLLDQFDDYQADPRHRERFLPADTRIWRDAASIARENAFWQMLRRCLQKDVAGIIVACRKEAAVGLESIRFRSDVPALELPLLESDQVRKIIDRLTERKPDQPAVIAEPQGGWEELRDRLVDDLKGRGEVLPQQLKVVLSGLCTLNRLTPTAYARAGRVIGLEAAFIAVAIARAANAAGRPDKDVLRLLSLLIDRRREPPDKAPPLPTRHLAEQSGVPEDGARRVLERLETDEIVRRPSETQHPTTGWQLDHAYLAQPILRIERARDRWQLELKDRARLYSEARWRKKWRALLPIGLQIQMAAARIRGRLRYGDYRGYALKSLARTVPAIAIPSLIAGLAWAANEYSITRRIEGKMASSLYSLSDEPASALTDLAVRSWAVRWLTARDVFREPQHAEWFNQAPGWVIRAWAQLDPERMDSLVRSYASPEALRQTDARLRSAAEGLVREASPTALTDATRAMLDRATSEILRADPKAALGRFRSDAEPLREGDPLARPFLAGLREALEKTRGYELRALAEAYASVPDFADIEPSAAKVLAGLRGTIAEYKPGKFADLESVVQAYVAVASKLKENDEVASEERRVLREAIGKTVDPDPLGALAQCYAAVTPKLRGFDPHAAEVMVALRDAISKATTAPFVSSFFWVKPLAKGYAAMIGQVEDADPQAGEVLAAIRKAIGEKVAEKTELYGSSDLYGIEDWHWLMRWLQQNSRSLIRPRQMCSPRYAMQWPKSPT